MRDDAVLRARLQREHWVSFLPHAEAVARIGAKTAPFTDFLNRNRYQR